MFASPIANFAHSAEVTWPKIQETHEFPNHQGVLNSRSILWVIDNSGSMEAHHKELADRAGSFFSTLAGRPGWKSAIVTSDSLRYGFESGGLNGSVPHLEHVFSSLVMRVGTTGSADEKLLRGVIDVAANHPDFFSQNLDIVFVTDAEDQSLMDTESFLGQLKAKTGLDRQSISVYGLLAAQDLGCSSAEGVWNANNSRYGELVSATTGKLYPICKDIGLALNEISAAIAKGIISVPNSLPSRYEIKLATQPDFMTLELIYAGKSLKHGRHLGGWILVLRLGSKHYRRLPAG